jgi:hypothetical protein
MDSAKQTNFSRYAVHLGEYIKLSLFLLSTEYCSDLTPFGFVRPFQTSHAAWESRAAYDPRHFPHGGYEMALVALHRGVHAEKGVRCWTTLGVLSRT